MKVSHLLLASFLFAFTTNTYSQWSSVLNPTTSNTKAASVVVDKVGNIYVGGYAYTNSTQLDDYYLVKYNPQGDTLWTRTYNRANGADQIVKVVVDADNNVIVTGTSYSSSTAEDIVTLKYNPSGQILAIRIYDGTNHLADKATDITPDNAGNYYISGTTRMTAYNGYALIKVNNQLVRLWAKTASPYYGSFTMKVAFNAACQRVAVTGYHTDWNYLYLIGTYVYDSTGVYLWSKDYRKLDTRSAVGYDLMLYDGGEVYVCGYENNASSNLGEALLIKYNNLGDTIWTKKVPAGSILGSVYKSMIHDNDGNIYVTGLKENTVITSKYTQDGTLLWMKEQPGENAFSITDTFESIKLDNSGNVLVLSRDFPANGGGVQLIKYSATGNFLWSKHYNGSPSQMDEPATLAIDASNNIYTAVSSRNNNYYIDMATVQFTPNLVNGLAENSYQKQMNIYPNPSKGLIYFNAENTVQVVKVFTSSGVKVFETELATNQNSIHLENLSNGFYFIQLEGDGISGYAKLMIRK